MTRYFILFTFYVLSVSSYAETLTFTSGDKQVNLVELYTSEGCSSCPPADEWLSQFKTSPTLWNEVIPVAFHVDYWDYIGWKDRFAQPKFTDRQRYYAYKKQVSGVYTPGMMLNGREWRGWYNQKTLPANTTQTGQLELNIEGDALSINYQSDSPEPLHVNIAVLGFDLHSDVNRGENHGRVLKHDFVVLGYQVAKLHNDQANHHTLNTSVPTHTIESSRLAIVAWVNKPSDLTPIQATGGWLN
jgi:hypothetical protein